MAWTTPKTDWATGELVAASDMNAIGENVAALKNPPTAAYTTTEDIGTRAREFADIDSDNLNLTIATNGGDVLVHFHGTVKIGSARRAYLDVDVDGTRQGRDKGILFAFTRSSEVEEAISFTYLIQNLNAGSHTFKLQWKTDAHTIVSAGAQFWVREI